MYVTNEEMRFKSISVAQNLLKIGVAKNDVLGLFTRNNTYLAPIVFGSLLIGAPINPLDPSYKIGIFTMNFEQILFSNFLTSNDFQL